MAGLVAARAVSDRYEKVIVVERDRLPDGTEPRRGVPQGQHLHALLASGGTAMEELYPGLLDEMTTAGALPYDVQADVVWYMDGRKLASAPSGIANYGLSRLLLERLTRARTTSLPNIQVLEETEARGLVTASGAITGVSVGTARSADTGERVIDADLVIDAAGRGSRALTWLEDLGHPRPPQSRVRADVVYLTRRYKAGPDALDEQPRAVVLPYPGSPRGGVVINEENGQICLVLAGQFGEDPPADDAGMLAFAESLDSPEILSLVRTGTPLGDPAKTRYPTSVRHHPERTKALPGNFLLLGDSLCSFNPAYGQGMTTAALQARLLHTLLAEGTDRLPQRFYPRAAKIIDRAWEVAIGGDLRFPEVEGKRPPGSGLVNRYMDRYRAAAARDPRLVRGFFEVSNMLKPPSALMSPKVILRVLTSKV